jgi:hypothetical protein
MSVVRWFAPVLWIGCFDPTLRTGLPCSASNDCPGDQACVDGICNGQTSIDATSADAFAADAGCAATCLSPVEIDDTCTGVGACPNGCIDGSPARCSSVTPSNGADPMMLVGVTAGLDAGGSLVVDTDTGTITLDGGIVRGPGIGVIAGIRYTPTLVTGVFAVTALTVPATGTLRAFGTRAAIFVVRDDATIAGAIDVGAGMCPGGASAPSCGGPGGGTGGTDVTPATGCAPGGRGDENGDTGGGGGGLGSDGADGGSETGADPGVPGSGGTVTASCPAASAIPIAGGSGGGRAGGVGSAGNGGAGGGGGGALQVTALRSIVVTGTIVAGGNGGRGPSPITAGGGGGGAVGTILLESAAIDLGGAIVAANGGGGGAGGTADPGDAGGASATPAAGGDFVSGMYGADGGAGGALGAPPLAGGDSNRDTGGGGGGFGIIRLHASSIAGAGSAIVSPAATTAIE